MTKPNIPWLDRFLTAAAAVLFLACLKLFIEDGVVYEFLGYILVSSIGLRGVKYMFRFVGQSIGQPANLEKPRNLRKFVDQSGQFTVHVVMTVLEVIVLSQQDWVWWTDTATCWTPNFKPPALLQSLYLAQTASWFSTAYSHRFVEAHHKDYFVMYAHHVTTIALCYGSYYTGTTRVGLLVLLVHDGSDIPADILKMVNYMGLDEKSGLYLTEISFVTTLFSWAYYRLYLFPFHVLASALHTESMPICEDTGNGMQCNIMRGLLCVLQCMHIWWFYLFLRIAYKLSNNSNAHDAGREEYEGTSASENEDPKKD